jgi:hypothetical protein
MGSRSLVYFRYPERSRSNLARQFFAARHQAPYLRAILLLLPAPVAA